MTMKETVIVSLPGGQLRGEAIDGVERFLGVRYGEDTAPRRFRRAQPAAPWSNVRDALAYTTQCPQPLVLDSPIYQGMEIPLPNSEDCLFLNVWTPFSDPDAKRPVLVWLHGGGFIMGSGVAHPYEGTRLVKRGDVVLVTVTHRLNVFGHMHLPELLGPEFAESGNVGMLDLVLALEWVRDNISEFGGDPGNVTIFGESGGGAKVHTLLAMPEAAGLFHRASIQSGGGGVAIEAAEAAAQPLELLEHLALKPQEAAQLLTLPAATLVGAFFEAFAANRFAYSRPVIDGEVLPRHPFWPDAPASVSDVPVMVGSTRTEATGLLGAFMPHLFDLEWDQVAPSLRPIVAEWGIYDTVPALAQTDLSEAVKLARQNMPRASPAEIYFILASQSMFIRGATRTAEQIAGRGGKAWLWSLDWGTPVDGGKWGAPHALDVPLFFDNVACAAAMLGKDMAEPQRVADQMCEALIAFAWSGDPNHPALPLWPCYSLGARETMIFDREPRVESDVNAWARELFGKSI